MVNSGDPDVEPRDEPRDNATDPDGAVSSCPRQRQHLNRALPLPDYGFRNLYRGQADNETNSEAH